MIFLAFLSVVNTKSYIFCVLHNGQKVSFTSFWCFRGKFVDIFYVLYLFLLTSSGIALIVCDPLLQYRNMLYGDAQSWAKRMRARFLSYIPGVINPHAKLVQWWNKIFVMFCILASFLDPFFFFLLFVRQVFLL